MALAGGMTRLRLFAKIELFKGMPQFPSASGITPINQLKCTQYQVRYFTRKFGTGKVTDESEKTLSSVIKAERISYKRSSSSSTTSSSSDSESDEHGRLKRNLISDPLKLFYTYSTDVTVEYCRGLPQVTVPLPSRRERCRFTLKPITNTVGDLMRMLKTEDKGIDRVVALAADDDTRIAASNTIENLLEEDFKLVINDTVYHVKPPKQTRITGEEAKRLSDIKTLVSQLYEAMNVQEHNIQIEKELSSKLETLRKELEPMEEKKFHLDMIAQRKSDWMAWIGLGLMSVQFGILARLTWWEYSWDIMEPVTYFVTYGTAMAGYAYFVVTKQEYVLKDVKDRQQLLTIHKKAKKQNFDLVQYNALKDQISQIERDLYKIQYPLQLHKPRSEFSGHGDGRGSTSTPPSSSSTSSESKLATIKSNTLKSIFPSKAPQ